MQSTVVRIQEEDYRKVRDLIFDQHGNYDPAVSKVVAAWNRPFDIVFHEVRQAVGFIALCTAGGIQATVV